MFRRDDRVVAQTLSRPERPDPVLGAILAGGASRRYGSDKALAMLNGAPLLHWVVTRVQPQVDRLVISGTVRRGFPFPVIADGVKDAGPLSALCAILGRAEQEGFPLVALFSCDTPFVPLNIVGDLRAALDGCDCAIAGRSGAMHPTFALWDVRAREKVETAFAIGVRSLRDAVACVNSTLVDFSALHHGPGGDPFFNINSPDDMDVARAWLGEPARMRAEGALDAVGRGGSMCHIGQKPMSLPGHR
jgi:molybdopterin-guanine dinucleotide biosynthesis protein A